MEVFHIELPVSCAILAGRRTLERASPRTGYRFPVLRRPKSRAIRVHLRLPCGVAPCEVLQRILLRATPQGESAVALGFLGK